jgi:CIC family chloride channel protein
MGTLFAGIIRAPMTSVFMIFEITQDYQILVPLMVANMLSFVISKRYQPVPIYHALLHQDGIHLPSVGMQSVMAGRTARHVMRSGASFIAPHVSLDDAWRQTRERAEPAYLVGTSDRLLGVITREELERWHTSQNAQDPIASVVEREFVHVHPDHPLDVVLDRLSETSGLLPVVSRTDVTRVEGVVTADSIVAIRTNPIADRSPYPKG